MLECHQQKIDSVGLRLNPKVSALDHDPIVHSDRFENRPPGPPEILALKSNCLTNAIWVFLEVQGENEGWKDERG